MCKSVAGMKYSTTDSCGFFCIQVLCCDAIDGKLPEYKIVKNSTSLFVNNNCKIFQGSLKKCTIK